MCQTELCTSRCSRSQETTENSSRKVATTTTTSWKAELKKYSPGAISNLLQAKSSTSVAHLQLRKEPACVEIYREGYLKTSPWVGARPVLGMAPNASRVGAPQVLGGSPVLAAGSVRLDRTRFTRVTPNPSGAGVAEESGVRSDAARLFALPCPASEARDRLASKVKQMLVVRWTALHMSWTTRHPSRPPGKSWKVAPAAREHNTFERHPATHLNCGPCSCLGSSNGVASPPLPNDCGRQLHGP